MSEEKIIIEFEGGTRWIETDTGATLLEAAADTGFEMSADCGGRGTCGKCRVRVAGDVAPPDDAERKHLSADELEQGFRLACRARARGNVSVEFCDNAVPAEILPFRMEYIAGRRLVPAPSVSKLAVEVSGFAGMEAMAAIEKLRADHVEIKTVSMSRQSVDGLMGIIASGAACATLIIDECCLVGIESGDTSGAMYGAAIDVGTTSLNARLVDLKTGRVAGSVISANPQRMYGADVASRLNHAAQMPGGLEAMRSRVVRRVNEMLARLAADCGMETGAICRLTLAGNPTMTSIFLGVDPRGIAPAPFTPPFTDALNVDAAEAGLEIAAGARLAVLPAVAGYVGADAVAAAIRVGMNSPGGPRLLIDLGTNAEIILTDGDRVYACAAAAGPALEGAHISRGMNARDGAVDSLEFRGGDVVLTTISNREPAGLCGTGLIDTIAALLDAGALAVSGRLAEKFPDGAGVGLADRLVESGAGREFVVARAGERGAARKISVTQHDVREVQLAKGAILAGVELLLVRAGIDAAALETIYLAGALGTFLKPRTALRVGLIPGVDPARVKFVGNAALDGAVDSLISNDVWLDALEFKDRVEYVELSAVPDFQERFSASMKFPEK